MKMLTNKRSTRSTHSENSARMSHNYPKRDKTYSGFSSLWVPPLPLKALGEICKI